MSGQNLHTVTSNDKRIKQLSFGTLKPLSITQLSLAFIVAASLRRVIFSREVKYLNCREWCS